MTCGSCVARVEQALASVEGVSQARVNLATETALVLASPPDVSAHRLIESVRQAGYDAEPARKTDSAGVDADHARSLQQQRQAVVQAIGLAVPIVLLQYLGPALSSTWPGGDLWWRAIQGILCGLLLVSSAGAPILIGGLRALVYRHPNMDLLVTLGVTAGFGAGVVSLLAPGVGAFYFDAAAMILTVISLGRYLEQRARQQAGDAVAALARRMPATAVCWRNEQWQTIPVDQVCIGDRVRVAEQVTVPVDGKVVEGSAALDQSAITGEFVPRSCSEGDLVRSGSMVREGMITLEATAVGLDSTLGRILRAVEDAQTVKTRWHRIADRVAGVFVPIVVAAALASLVGWLAGSYAGWFIVPDGVTSIGWALRNAVAVLVVACPCAMGLATPTAVMVATGTAAARGILLCDAAALERAASVDAVLLDKTGTLTTGHAEVKAIYDEPTGPITTDEKQVILWAASAEQFSQHPLAMAIVAKAKQWGLSLREPDAFVNHAGQGISAEFGQRRVLVGNQAMMEQHDIDLEAVQARYAQITTDGQTGVFLALDGVCAGLIGLSDTLRPDAAQAVERLARMGLDVAMVTGDNEATASALAGSAGIAQVHARMLPEQKLAEVRRRQEAGQRVAFVGDGINDASALTGAEVGLAFATGTDVAVASADITLLGSELRSIPETIQLARR
ncbi:MAG: heavy metal translocating P-type ATPase, partial [Phycisphaerae bacterium]